MPNKSPFNGFFSALKSTNPFKNNHVTDVTGAKTLRLHENPFKINRVTDVTALFSYLDITFRGVFRALKKQ